MGWQRAKATVARLTRGCWRPGQPARLARRPGTRAWVHRRALL